MGGRKGAMMKAGGSGDRVSEKRDSRSPCGRFPSGRSQFSRSPSETIRFGISDIKSQQDGPSSNCTSYTKAHNGHVEPQPGISTFANEDLKKQPTYSSPEGFSDIASKSEDGSTLHLENASTSHFETAQITLPYCPSPDSSSRMINKPEHRGNSCMNDSKNESAESSPQGSSSNISAHSVYCSEDQPFDICSSDPQSLKKSGLVKLQPSLLDQSRERRKEQKRSQLCLDLTELRPGMIYLKNYLTLADQVEIIKICRRLGIGNGGFYQPGFSSGNKMHLHMMCLGKNWDPESSKYGNVRTHDGAKPPDIPDNFKRLVQEVLQKAREHSNKDAKLKLPMMRPDICIVNFYSKSGKLGLHQDKDESLESIREGLPVVSFSIGDSAEFLFGEDRDLDKAAKRTLESGDVLIFGGKSRLIFHGVPTILPDTAPKSLLEQSKLRPGRLNLTFRQY